MKKWEASKKLKSRKQTLRKEEKERIASEQKKKQYSKMARLFHACGNLAEEIAKK